MDFEPEEEIAAMSIEECQQTLLGLALEFDRICRKHGIPYYMLGGTMLGAVRHRGFIPWDDDMDFGVPRAWFDRLKAVLAEELPRHARVHELNSPAYHLSNFLKIDDGRTRLAYRGLEWISGLGVNIDIFPLDDGLRTAAGTRRFVRYILFFLQWKDLLRIDPAIRKGAKKGVAEWVRLLLPVSAGRLLRHVERSIRRFATPDSPFYVNYYGAWGLREMVAKRDFGQPKEYPFGEYRFYGVDDADAYLTRLYGDYMQLPPADQQTHHASCAHVLAESCI
ncbi:MAG: LicD family protein [Tannerella sp.]|nr:LicD family protein [Tannerella sp.]